MRLERAVLLVVGIIQIAIGALYLVTPERLAGWQQIHPVDSARVDLLLTAAGARFIGYGIGILAAAYSPVRHRLWIITMVAIQAVDFAASFMYGSSWMSPTVWLPLMWVLLLSWISWRAYGMAHHRLLRPGVRGSGV